MNAIPGRVTLGRAVSSIEGAADDAVTADVDAAQELRDAATRFHALLSQTQFVIAPPVDLTLITAAVTGLAALDLDAYQRRIGDQAAGVAGRLDPDHMDDTGILSPAGPDWFDCHPTPLTTVTTALVPATDHPGFAFLEINTEARDRLCGPRREQALHTEVPEQWLRQMRALIDRVLGDRT